MENAGGDRILSADCGCREMNGMHEQDYIMRLIKEMVRTILKLVFNIDMDSPEEELLAGTQYEEVSQELLHMVDCGNINEAEDRLFELSEDNNKHKLETALLFYSHLNKKDDDFLQKNNFSREEITLGLKTIISDYGLGTIAESFLSEL